MQQEKQPNLFHVKHLTVGCNKKIIKKRKRLALINLFHETGTYQVFFNILFFRSLPVSFNY